MRTPSNAPRGRRRLDAAATLLFAAASLAPWADALARPAAARGPAPESRAPAPAPHAPRDLAELRAWPAAVEAHLDDTLGLRDVLLRGRSIVFLSVLRVSPTDRAYLGRAGWMFYAGAHSADAFRGVVGNSTEEVRAICAELRRRRDLVRACGATYLAVIVPDKETIYPELVPAVLERIGPTRLQLLREEFARASFDDWLDLVPILTSQKGTDLGDGALYSPLGTHWQHRGTLAVYRALLERIARRLPTLRALDEADLQLVPAPRLYDSWARRMYVEDLYPATPLEPLPRHPLAALVAERSRHGPGSVRRTTVDDPGLPRAVLFHDSFGPYLERLLAEHFGSLVCVWGGQPEKDLVDRLKPNVVVELIVERNMGRLIRRDTDSADE
jgi:hypothetical protein